MSARKWKSGGWPRPSSERVREIEIERKGRGWRSTLGRLRGQGRETTKATNGELEPWKASFSGRKAPGNSNLWHGQPSRVSSLSTRSNRSNALRWAKFSKTRGNKIQCCLFFFRSSDSRALKDITFDARRCIFVFLTIITRLERSLIRRIFNTCSGDNRIVFVWIVNSEFLKYFYFCNWHDDDKLGKKYFSNISNIARLIEFLKYPFDYSISSDTFLFFNNSCFCWHEW